MLQRFSEVGGVLHVSAVIVISTLLFTFTACEVTFKWLQKLREREKAEGREGFTLLLSRVLK